MKKAQTFSLGIAELFIVHPRPVLCTVLSDLDNFDEIT